MCADVCMCARARVWRVGEGVCRRWDLGCWKPSYGAGLSCSLLAFAQAVPCLERTPPRRMPGGCLPSFLGASRGLGSETPCMSCPLYMLSSASNSLRGLPQTDWSRLCVRQPWVQISAPPLTYAPWCPAGYVPSEGSGSPLYKGPNTTFLSALFSGAFFPRRLCSIKCCPMQ